MRLLLLLTITLFAFTLSAQDCVEGKGLITMKIVQETPCVEYKTTMILANDQRYIIALSSSANNVTVARSLERRFLGKKSWPRTSEGVKLAVEAYNEYIKTIKNQ
jgi:hypothetical protein